MTPTPNTTLASSTHPSLLQELPKVELHVHIEGTLEPEHMCELLARKRPELETTPDQIRRRYNFSCLQDFLDLYYDGCNLLTEEEDFYELTWRYLKRVHSENVVHCEIFCDPQAHASRVSFEDLCNGMTRAMERAEKEFGMTSYIVPCILRHLSQTEAEKTLDEILAYRSTHKDNRIVAIGLDSSEVGFPPELFAKVFHRARRAGLKVCCHAGEEGPPEYVWSAIGVLHAERIDHGIRCIEDPKLCMFLTLTRIPIDVCPLSNVKLCAVPSPSEHPLKQMLHAGLCVSIHSDDPAYFGGYMMKNYEMAIQDLGLSLHDIFQLAANAIESSFLPDKRKTTLFKRLKAVERHQIPTE